MEFVNLPPGQRVLILCKISDIVGSNDRDLRYAGERLLQLMLTRGVLLDSGDYREIVKPAIQWAFEMEFDDRVGRESIREELEIAAFIARDKAHAVLTSEMLEYLKAVDLTSKPEWYLHTVRSIIQALMANPECNSEDSAALGAILRNINRVQRSKPSRLSAASIRF